MRKFISIFLLLWLPLVSGNALAQAMLMSWEQLTQASCPEHHDASPNCVQCEFCQMACSACLPSTALRMAVNPLPQADFAPFLGKWRSLIFPPLDPPPIAA